jgi:N-acetylglucosaminyldiphosphoundecaprenol N-acetyl-beta-D-mannosaminyltransferase
VNNRNVPAEISLRGIRLSLVAGVSLLDAVLSAVISGRRGYVCVANVHQITEGWTHDSFGQVLNNALLVSTDSRVLELCVRSLGCQYASPVLYGVELFKHLCERAAEAGIALGIFGGSPAVAEEIRLRLRDEFPSLNVAFIESPPIGTAEQLANDATVGRIKASGARLLLVGLGCPKQENWMHLASQQLDCVAIGLGAAFDFFARKKKLAPRWVRRAGFDWLYRLVSEPKRLWRRYIIGNAVFLLRFLPLLIRQRLFRRTLVES